MKRTIFLFFLFFCTHSFAPKVAIKNNLAYDALKTPNLSLEFSMGRKWTLDTQVGMNFFFYTQDATSSRYRNYKAVLHRNNVVCGQFKVFVPLKEYDIPAECVDKLSTPLEYLEIQPRILRNLRRYNIYLLEDLLRFIKKNGFDALGKLHGVGKRSCEDLYLILKDKDILTSKDTCHLFRYILI